LRVVDEWWVVLARWVGLRVEVVLDPPPEPSFAGQASVSLATDSRTGMPVSALPEPGLWKQTFQSAAAEVDRFAPVASVTLMLPNPAPDAAPRATVSVSPVRLGNVLVMPVFL
jgi:hypothetical protein